MLFKHATLRRHLPSILARGLLCSKSKGKLRVVWLHTPSASPWAVIHTHARHGGRVEDVVVLEIDVPRSRVRRNRRRLWTAAADIGPEHIRNVVSFNRVAASPVAVAG
jgi:hypothetical protein